MTFGVDRTIECVHCGTPLILESFASTSSIGATVWTDGYVDSPRTSTAPVVTKCPTCGRWFAINEAPLVSEEVAAWERGQPATIEAEDTLSSEAYQEALDNSWDRETEVALRLRLWWRENQPRRRRPGVDEAVVEALTLILQENLRALLPLLGDDDQVLLQAEALRELGMFDKAIQTLESVVPIDEYDVALEVGEVIRWEAQRENTLPAVVRKVPPFSPRLTLQSPELSFSSESDSSVAEVRGDSYGVIDALRAGFYPRPFTEDLFAFPTEEKESRFSAMVALRLEAPNLSVGEVEGWLPFMAENYSLCIRYGRLFTRSESEQFEALTPRAKRQLRAFWSMKSYQLPVNRKARDQYFRELYYLFWHGPGPLPEESECKPSEKFSHTWEELLEENWLLGSPFIDWFELNRSRIYWDVYWRVRAGSAKPRELLGLREIENAMVGELTYLYGIRRQRLELIRRRPTVIVRVHSATEARVLLDSGRSPLSGENPRELRLDRRTGRIVQREQ